MTIPKTTAIVLDIEGTVLSIAFVKQVLFPFVTSNLSSFLQTHWESLEMQEHVQALSLQSQQDVEVGLKGAVLIPLNSTETQSCVKKNIEWQMSSDRKIRALKAFQGYMWRSGYESGEIMGTLYDDVLPALNRWKHQKIQLYIYSSGSIQAQKLLFGYTTQGDLLPFFHGHFDTSIGPKTEAESYVKIARDIQTDPSHILFLSDNVLELIAAKSAGLQAQLAMRPGNAPVSSEHVLEFNGVSDFSLIH